ncbi:MAG TPA: dihydroneopterin aldolase [Bacteroidota bacterium]|nr:dihydroneopterin aldolase [Bacteroidota bacterium]
MHSDVIRIHNASFYAYHGVASDEQNLGGKFEVDVELESDLSAAAEKDSLKRTVDYQAVYAFIQQTVTQKKYYLLESLAKTIARGIIREFPAVESARVKVRKPHPPVKGVVDYVEVEVSESRK